MKCKCNLHFMLTSVGQGHGKSAANMKDMRSIINQLLPDIDDVQLLRIDLMSRVSLLWPVSRTEVLRAALRSKLPLLFQVVKDLQRVEDGLIHIEVLV